MNLLVTFDYKGHFPAEDHSDLSVEDVQDFFDQRNAWCVSGRL